MFCMHLENQQFVLEIRLAETGPLSSLYFFLTTLFSYHHLQDELNIKFLGIALVTLTESWAGKLPADFPTKIFLLPSVLWFLLQLSTYQMYRVLLLLNLDKMCCHRVLGTYILKFGKYVYSIDISRLLAYYGQRRLEQSLWRESITQ